MNLSSIAYNNFKRNIKVYRINVMAMIFSVAIYYNFISIKSNPQIMDLSLVMRVLKETSAAASVLLLVFLVFFIWFSNSFFLKQKKKEIGIYTFAGIDNYKIALIFSIESFFIGAVSIIVGIFVGILFSKLFIMLLVKVAYLNIKLKFFVPIKAVIETASTFLIVFLVISFTNYISVIRSKLIDLFNASKRHEGVLKVNYVKAIGSILIILTAYIMCIKLSKAYIVVSIPIITVLVIWGTYWLFDAFFSLIMKYVINKKSILYNGTNIVSMSNIAFRIKGNYKTFATIAVLITAAITALGTAISIRYNVNLQSLERACPYSFSYILDKVQNEKIKTQVHKTLSESKHNVLLNGKSNLLIVDKFNTNFNFNDKKIMIVKYSDFNKMIKNFRAKHYKDIIKESDVSRGQCVYVERPEVIMSAENDKKQQSFYLNNLNLKVKSKIKTPLFGEVFNSVALVVNDLDYNHIKNKFKEYEFTGITVDNQDESLDLALKLKSIKYLDKNLSAYVLAYKAYYAPYGIIFFMGSILAMVFLLATGSIIYFKILTEAYMDKNKYDILIKMGIMEKELKSIISKQVFIYFILPLVIGVIHGCFAILVLSRLITCNLVIYTIMSILIFTAIYLIFYFVSVKKFRKVIS